MAARNQAGKNETKDLKCAIHLLSEKFRNMSEEKKTIVRDLGFSGLMHIPPLRVHHQVLRELANNFKLGENRLETSYGSFKIRPKTIGDALSINASGDLFPQKVNYKDLSEDDKEIFRRFQGKTLKNLTDEMMDIGVDKKRAERPPKSWIANWSKEQLVERMRAKIEENMASSTSSSETETTDSDSSTSESETQEDSEDSPRKEPSKKGKKMDSKKRKKSQEDSDSESESTDETQSKKKKVVVEHSSPEQDQFYHGSEIGSEDLDEFLRENNEKSAAEEEKEADLRSTEGKKAKTASMLSLVDESASEPADSNMMVVREETPSEGLAITPESPPPQLEESTPTLLPAPSKINPAPEDAAALMMMAWTASYVPKKDPMPSFSLGFTDSSQEETTTQEGASTQDEHMAKTPETPKLLEQLEDLVHKIASGVVTKKEKSPEIPKESGAESFEKFEIPVRPNLNTTDMKQKCYHWAIRVKTYADGLTDEFDNVCRLQAQDSYTLSKLYLASLAPKMHIEAEIVSAMCFIINQQNIQRFQEEVYCLPPDIVGYVISRIKVYAGGAPLKSKDKDREIVAPYLHISGQKTSYDCAIYVMKWLEIFEPANIKRQKYEWDNWTQDEVDHFRVEYASRILFHDMNLDKDEAIRGSNAIRLSKPSSLLLSPYCQIDSQDVDTV
ncbi:uncharacterized protein DS421_14g470030 [Arachis hypogaea]|nr:uncharacterized protein DS421_14g470030 [Arachis hypogaea]